MNKKNEFNFEIGRKVSNRFTVQEFLGKGSEGEVYKVIEGHTGNIRAIKIYYPDFNYRFKASARYAQKLEKLRDSKIVMNYLSHETILVGKQKVACIVSEFIDGEILHDFVTKQKSKRLGIFPAIHLLYSIVNGVESIHNKGEYHGDLHTENIIIQKFGLEFELKIIDLHHWGDSKKDNRDEDIIKVIKIFYDILGGQKYYSSLPSSIKYIVCGLKRGHILDRFRNISALKNHLERMDWSDAI